MCSPCIFWRRTKIAADSVVYDPAELVMENFDHEHNFSSEVERFYNQGDNVSQSKVEHGEASWQWR